MADLTNFLLLGYKEASENEKMILERLKNDKQIGFLTYRSFKGINERKSWYYLFVEKNLEKAKQCFYLYGKLMEYLCNTVEVDISPGMAQDATYTLLSDSSRLIESFGKWRYNDYDKFIKKGETKRIIQLIATENDAEAFSVLENFYAKHKKYAFKEMDGAILQGILEKDKPKIEENLNVLLTPRNHKRRNGIYPMRKDLFSFPALGFAKLAWLRGIEVEIDHPLIPNELLPIRPNPEYVDSYDFLKRDNTNHNTV